MSHSLPNKIQKKKCRIWFVMCVCIISIKFSSWEYRPSFYKYNFKELRTRPDNPLSILKTLVYYFLLSRSSLRSFHVQRSLLLSIISVALQKIDSFGGSVLQRNLIFLHLTRCAYVHSRVVLVSHSKVEYDLQTDGLEMRNVETVSDSKDWHAKSALS